MKITIIGGAGVRTVNFINGLLGRYKKLDIKEVVLFDIDRPKLRIIEKLSRHAVARKNEHLTVRAEEDLDKALDGADYVVTTLRVGGDHARVTDEAVALEHGVIGQETTGAGGFSMAVRTIPILLDYCEKIKRLAPQAWVFNFTNPSGLVTQALNDAGYDRIIGICDAPSSTKTRIAEALGMSEADLYVEFFGLNHLSWISSVKAGEKELLPSLINDDAFLGRVQEFKMFDKEAFALTGFLPNEYLYYYYHREKALGNIQKSGKTRGQTIEDVNKAMFEELSGMAIDDAPEEALQTFLYYIYLREYSYMSIETASSEAREIVKGQLEIPSGMGYAGVMLDCIEGLQSEKPKALVLSVQNRGAITGFESNDVVEITCNVSKKGIEPIKVASMPEHCYLLMRMIKMYERKTVEALREHSRGKAVDALTLHPLVGSFSLAGDLVSGYEKAYGKLF